MEERKCIFDEFYKLAEHDSQNKYPFGLIECNSPKQRRPQACWGSHGVIRCYFVRPSNGDQVRVFKKGFCQIHAIARS